MSPESCKAASDEERLLLKKISDLVRRSEKEYSVLYSSFLTPAEQCLISDETEFSGIVGFDGGYEDAERRMCRVCTDEFQRDEGAPLVLLCCEMSDRNADISHRDVLGSLMGLGIRREMIGDIMADGRTARFFCSKSVSEFIMQSLERIGKYKAVITIGDVSSLPPPKTEKRTINVSALRLDCICAEGFGLSRTKAQELIRKSLVSINWRTELSPSRVVSEGEKISARGRGKLIVGSVSGTSRKGRIFLEIYNYI